MGGATYAPGKVGAAFSFNGTNSGVLISNSPSLNCGAGEDLSIETWIKARPTPAKEVLVIVDKRETPNIYTAIGYSLCLDNGFLCFQLATGPANRNYWSPPNLRDDQWHHVAVSVRRNDRAGGKLYVDGREILVFDPTPFSGSLSNGAPLKIGYHADPSYDGYFSGLIDELSLYRRALASNEIAKIYQAGSAGKLAPFNYPQDGIPVGWRYRFFGATSIDNPLIAANADPDQDGANNYEEFLAGTNPLDPNSKPTNAVALVAFDPVGGEFTNFVSVNLTTPVVNGTIHYAIDDLSATNASPLTNVYSDPVQTDAASAIRAMVYVNGYPVSRIYTNTYVRVYAIDDGIPNDWREEYFGSGYRTDPRVAADADPDGDGANNLAEYLAGTDPTDPKSVLKIAGIRLVPVVTWDSVSNKLYRVLRRDDINKDEWVALKPLVRATNSESSFTDYAATNRNAFYWIEPLTP